MAIPCVAVMLEVPETPPEVETDSADTVAEPPTLSATLLLESSIRLHPFMTTCAVPCRSTAFDAERLRANTQPLPPVPMATARAEITTDCECHSRDSNPV